MTRSSGGDHDALLPCAELLATLPLHLRPTRLHRAGGDNADSLRGGVLGADFRLTWRPPEAGTRKEVTLRMEGYRLHAHEVGLQTNRYGAFVDLTARLSQRWILGGRYDYVEAARGPFATPSGRSCRPSPGGRANSSSCGSKASIATDIEGGNRNLLLLQAVFAMGPHKHETY